MMKNNRRDFVKKAALVTATAALVNSGNTTSEANENKAAAVNKPFESNEAINCCCESPTPSNISFIIL